MRKCKICSGEVLESAEVTCSIVCKKQFKATAEESKPAKRNQYYAEVSMPIEVYATSAKEASRLAGKLTKLLKSKRLRVTNAGDTARILNNQTKIINVRHVRRVIADEQRVISKTLI